MKTEEGWVRGKDCGKPRSYGGQFVCAHCNRIGRAEKDLCYPTKGPESLPTLR